MDCYSPSILQSFRSVGLCLLSLHLPIISQQNGGEQKHLREYHWSSIDSSFCLVLHR